MLAPPGASNAPVAGGAAPTSGAAGASLPLVDAVDTPGAGSGMRVEVGQRWLTPALAARLRCEKLALAVRTMRSPAQRNTCTAADASLLHD